jgi:hypothetical protein
MEIETDTAARNAFSSFFSQDNPCKSEYLTPLFKPKHQTFLYFIKRKETFQYWPSQMVQKPLDLVRNVFFFIPVWVIVPPVFIVVSLKQWDRNDYIETEHLKWEPTCLFAKTISSKSSNCDVLCF